ncbi:short chain dehydrogenase [Aspergillus crustosus]
MQKQHHTPSVLITGCGKGGIGHALAIEFQQKGHTIFATLLSHEPPDHLTETGITAVSADVTSDEDVQLLRYTMMAIDTDVREAEKMFAVNVVGPMRMVHLFHPLLIRAQGKVVNIGSVGGIVPYVYGSSYNATKAALHHWGNTLRVELKPFGVDVVNIISGEIGTNILKRDRGRQLPKDSFYAPLAKYSTEFNSGWPDRVRKETTPPAEYARAVVAEGTKQRPRSWFWTGATTSLVWFGDTFLPRWIWDWLFMREFQLNRLSRT